MLFSFAGPDCGLITVPLGKRSAGLGRYRCLVSVRLCLWSSEAFDLLSGRLCISVRSRPKSAGSFLYVVARAPWLTVLCCFETWSAGTLVSLLCKLLSASTACVDLAPALVSGVSWPNCAFPWLELAGCSLQNTAWPWRDVSGIWSCFPVFLLVKCWPELSKAVQPAFSTKIV